MRKHPKYQRMHNKVKHCDTRIPINSRAVDISKLKASVEEIFPPESSLRIIFADEEDLLIWLKFTKLFKRD
jgi:tRNA threonylcarbamoyladenosine modification (KEOPS) complex  Pcc1 subunit